jgi:DNA repair protein RadC
MQLFIKCGTRYKPATQSIIKSAAASYLDHDIDRKCFTEPGLVANYLIERMGQLENENFGIVFLDSRHKVIEFKIMFTGTIDQSAVYPREIIKHALAVNCAAMILAHNHPSGHCEPSNSDRQITMVIKDALNFVDVRLLDHFVIGGDIATSFAERGYL